MRQAAKVDANQAELVKMLRQCGVTVQILSAVGKGCPDLLCGAHGHKNVLLEVKDGSRFPSEQKLTADEKTWHENWNGQVAIVSNFDEAMDAITRAK